MQLLDKRMRWLAAALSALHHAFPSIRLRVLRKENPMRRDPMGVRVRRVIHVVPIYRVYSRRARCCYARNVFNFSEPCNHIARMHVQPCGLTLPTLPRGYRAISRGEYSGYNGCCEHLRFSACETSSSSTLKSLLQTSE